MTVELACSFTLHTDINGVLPNVHIFYYVHFENLVKSAYSLYCASCLLSVHICSENFR